MEDINHPAATLSGGSSMSDALNEIGVGGLTSVGLNSSDNLELQTSLVKQKEAEMKEMQEQIESINQMVKQLTSQRELAIKRLADMDVKIKEMTATLETERRQVDAKDHELKSKRTQLQTLKNEEDELKIEFERSRTDLETTVGDLATINLNNTQISSTLSEIKQYLTDTNIAIEEIENAIEFKDTMRLGSLCDRPLAPPPALSVKAILTNGKTNSNQNETNNTRPFDASGAPSFDPFSNEDPFEGEDPFAGDDPFKSGEPSLALPEDDPFNPSSTATSNVPFSTSSIDPFYSSKRSMDGF